MSTTTDRHMTIIDQTNNREFDLWGQTGRPRRLVSRPCGDSLDQEQREEERDRPCPPCGRKVSTRRSPRPLRPSDRSARRRSEQGPVCQRGLARDRNGRKLAMRRANQDREAEAVTECQRSARRPSAEAGTVAHGLREKGIAPRQHGTASRARPGRPSRRGPASVIVRQPDGERRRPIFVRTVGDRLGLSPVMPVAVFPRERAPALLRKTRGDCTKLLERNLQALTDRIRTKRVIRLRRRYLRGAAATRFGKAQLPQKSVYDPDDFPSVAVLAHASPPSRAGPAANPSPSGCGFRAGAEPRCRAARAPVPLKQCRSSENQGARLHSHPVRARAAFILVPRLFGHHRLGGEHQGRHARRVL